MLAPVLPFFLHKSSCVSLFPPSLLMSSVFSLFFSLSHPLSSQVGLPEASLACHLSGHLVCSARKQGTQAVQTHATLVIEFKTKRHGSFFAYK